MAGKPGQDGLRGGPEPIENVADVGVGDPSVAGYLTLCAPGVQEAVTNS